MTRDSSGNKILDAKVRLKEPCPFCEEKHTYEAVELACPFEIMGTGENSKELPMADDIEKVKLTKTVTGSG